MKAILVILTGFFLLIIAHAQSTFIFDQHSTTNYAGETVGGIPITDQPLGQSFTPALSSIDFVRIRISLPNAPLSATGSLVVNLWSGGISNGVLLASAIPAAINLAVPGSVIYTNLFFPSSVSLTPGATYYFQPLATSLVTGFFNGPFDVGLYSPRAYPATYPGGMAFVNGTAYPDEDLWFWEGVVVPEPSVEKLLLAVMLGISPFLRRIERFADRPSRT